MYDNGLLKYYQTLPSNNGFLDITGLNFTENLNLKRGKVRRGNINGSSYYIKSAVKAHQVNKDFFDAEIMLSQLYYKAGIRSAIYLPVTLNSTSFLASDDVERKDVVLAKRFQYECTGRTSLKPISFLSQQPDQEQNANKFFTKSAMAQQTKMRILDTATCNFDRHRENFYYSLNRPLSIPQSEQQEEGQFSGRQIVDYFRNLIPNKAKDVVAIDFGISGNVIPIVNMGRQYEDSFDIQSIYPNDFGPKLLNRDQMKDSIIDNKKLAELIDKEDFAETLGSLNPSEVAQDVLDTTGYKVDPAYTSFLSRSLDDMADILIQ